MHIVIGNDFANGALAELLGGSTPQVIDLTSSGSEF